MKEYPGYEPTDGEETFDFPYHGEGRKGIRHKIPLPDENAEIRVQLGVSRVWDDPSVNLDVAIRFRDITPGGNVRINPGRPDKAETIIDGYDGH